MDTSEQYCKMSEKFNELYPDWHYDLGDYVADTKHRTVWLITGDDEEKYYLRHLEPQPAPHPYTFTCMKAGAFGVLFPLPRQDQLQEMVEDPDWDGLYFAGQGRYDRPRALSYALCKFIQTDIRTDSMEQLWLAFAMKEKYQKFWDGEDWVLDDKGEATTT